MQDTATKITIKHRWTNAALFECDVPADKSGMAMRWALERATTDRANLSGAYLRGADLSDANLSGAYLRGADLSDANLSGAYLRGADLSDANLSGANLRGAYLRGADLSGAYLRGADLSDANLSGAYLRGANLSGANLRGADLSDANLSGAVLSGANLSGANLSGAYLSGAYLSEKQLRMYRDDIWAVLSSAPHEAGAVLEALRAGRVDGSTYSGDCACLVGTIAKARQCAYDSLGALEPDAGRYAEQWFMQIKPGQTPDSHKPSALAAQWVSEWIDAMTAAFGPKVSA